MDAPAVAATHINFNVERDYLLSALQSVTGVVERRQTLPILANVLLEFSADELKITGTDLEVELIARCVISNYSSHGSIAVPARKFVDLCRSLPEGAIITAVLDKQNLVLKSGGSRFILACLPAAEFPHVPPLQNPLKFTISSENLGKLLYHTQFAMAQQDVRYFLNGCLLHIEGQTITVVATDGHRLALAKRTLGGDNESVDSNMDKRVIIPRKAVLELIRLLQKEPEILEVSLDNNHICFKSNTFAMISKLIEGRFPDYHRVIPRHNDKNLLVDKNSLKQALMRVAVLANEKHHGVKLDLKPGSLTLSTNNPEREQAEDVLAVDYQSDIINIGFNGSYLLDILNVQPEGIVKWQLSNSSGSVLLENTVNQQENIYVVMPMRL